MIGTYLGMSQNRGAQECPKPLFFSKEEVKQEAEKQKACEASELLEQALLERDQDKKEKKQGRGMKRPAAAKQHQ